MKGFTNAIISGDFNAQHDLWGSTLNNPRGNILFDILLNSHLKPLNNGEATRLHNVRGSNSVPDLTLVTPDLAIFTKWETFKDPLRSDHYPVVLQVSKGNLIKGEISHRIGVSRVDWSKFSEELTLYCNSRPLLEDNNYIQEYEEFVKGIKISLERSGALMLDDDDNGNRPARKIFSPALWWDPECDEGVTERRAALREYVNHSTFDNFDYYELVASAGNY